MFPLVLYQQLSSPENWDMDYLSGNYHAVIDGMIFELYDREQFLNLVMQTCNGVFGNDNYNISLTNDDKKTVKLEISQEMYTALLLQYTAGQEKIHHSKQVIIARTEVGLINIISSVDNNEWTKNANGSASITVTNFEAYMCEEGDSFYSVFGSVVRILEPKIELRAASNSGYKSDVTITIPDFSALEAAVAKYQVYALAKSNIPTSKEHAEEIVAKAVKYGADLQSVPDYEKRIASPWGRKTYLNLVEIAVANEKYELAAVLQKAVGSERADKAIKNRPQGPPGLENPT